MRKAPILLGLAALAAGCGGCDGGSSPDAGVDGGDLRCPVAIVTRPQAPAASVVVAGEWDGFDRARGVSLDGPDADGRFRGSVAAPPGHWAYDLLVDGAARLDPTNGLVKYVDGAPRSALRVADCRDPALAVVAGSARAGPGPAEGQGTFAADLEVDPGVQASDPVRVEGTVRSPGDRAGPGWAPRELTSAELALDAGGALARVRLSGLAAGKHTVAVRAVAGARASDELLLPFWVEPEPFAWVDTPLYMAVTDRFRDGDPSNSPPALDGVPFPADFHGGDLDGVRQAVADGWFDRLGIRALWLTPWQTQPLGPWPEINGSRLVTGYHGYWPIRAREVDPRLGGDVALHRLVEEAHRHRIRVVMDAVLNHVHVEHEYFSDPARRGWFRTGCICGQNGCDWDRDRLTCQFTDYMPDVDWTVNEAAQQFVDDVLWWMQEFDVDGLRVDAVKQIEDSAISTLATRVRERFEQAGTRVFLFGETFSGDYAVVARAIGATMLDGQLDFPLFFQVPDPVFAVGDKGFLHAKYWTEESQARFPGATMVTFLGSHDVARFVTRADPANRSRASSKWTDLPAAPADVEPYDRLWLAMLEQVTTPGVPLLYYGDEIGEHGGSDPDNRHDLAPESGLTSAQAAQLARTRGLLGARARLRGLARGPLMTIFCTEDLWAYARPDPDPTKGAVVVLNRQAAAWAGVVVALPAELGWAGSSVEDALTGRTWPVVGGAVTVEVPGRGGLILALP